MKQDENGAVKRLVSKLVEVLSELGPVEKKGRNVHFGYNYVSEGQLMAELRHRLSNRKVLFTTSVISINSEERQNAKGNSERLVTVQTQHSFIDAESGASLVMGGAGMGIDSGDKGVYKAITGATKYALMKNFMITDEQDPEADETDREQKHTRTREYEREPLKKGTAAAADLVTLREWLNTEGIPEDFVLAELIDKGLAEADTETLDGLKPGVVTRTLKSKDRLAASYLKSKKADKSEKKQVRTREGDQTVGVRRPCQTDISPVDLLDQEGVEDWRTVEIHFGKKKGVQLGELDNASLLWWTKNWHPENYKNRGWKDEDLLLDAALCVAAGELAGE